MAADHSFDVVCKLDKQEVVNAVAQAEAEARQRYDLRGTKFEMKFDQAKMTLLITADSDFHLKSLTDILDLRLAKRQIPLAAITRGKIETAPGGGARQEYSLQQGIPSEKAKEVVKLVRDSKLKLQASIQGDQVRISGRVLDELQQAQQLIRGADLKIHVQFVNYR
jgi:cyclic-di-GMP-binding protein